MKYEIRLQDPAAEDTIYLVEAFIGVMSNAKSGIGIFAFASRLAVDWLLADPQAAEFVMHREFKLIVGIDAITTRATLERLHELEQTAERLIVRVFWNTTKGLFHPKLGLFWAQNGRQTLIVGSGNLTPGGMRNNIEAYTVATTAAGGSIDVSSVTNFIQRHDAVLRPIDDEVLKRAESNKTPKRQHVPAHVEPDEAVDGVEDTFDDATVDAVGEGEGAAAPANDRILIARVPGAGGRWHQVHFNEAVVEEFFRIEANTQQRLFLRERQENGVLLPLEPPRPLVLSGTNLNRKIELAARASTAYPQGGFPPIAVFRERGIRQFHYMLLMPGETGYDTLYNLTEVLPSVGRGLPRVMTDIATLEAQWPTCPLLLADAGT